MSLLQLFCLTWSLQRLARFKTHLSSLTALCLSVSWENASRRLQLWGCLHLSYSFISASNWILNVLTMSQKQGQTKSPDENAAAALNLPQSCLLALKLPTLITLKLISSVPPVYLSPPVPRLGASEALSPVAVVSTCVLELEKLFCSESEAGWFLVASRTRVCTVPFFPVLASMSLGSWALNFRGLRSLCTQHCSCASSAGAGMPWCWKHGLVSSRQSKCLCSLTIWVF